MSTLKCGRQFGCHSCTSMLREVEKKLDELHELIHQIIEEDEAFTREQVDKLKQGGY